MSPAFTPLRGQSKVIALHHVPVMFEVGSGYNDWGIYYINYDKIPFN